MTDFDTLPHNIRPGNRFEIGTYTFNEDEIIRFAKSWDPQTFHLDKEKAKNSLFGGLCASGWHTISVWMKLQRRYTAAVHAEAEEIGEKIPEFGPSPGMSKIKWIKPVFAGDTVRYENEITGLRESKSRPGWSLMTSKVHASNQNNEPVMTFESAVFIRV